MSWAKEEAGPHTCHNYVDANPLYRYLWTGIRGEKKTASEGEVWYRRARTILQVHNMIVESASACNMVQLGILAYHLMSRRVEPSLEMLRLRGVAERADATSHPQWASLYIVKSEFLSAYWSG
jgi:hypothetical protein